MPAAAAGLPPVLLLLVLPLHRPIFQPPPCVSQLFPSSPTIPPPLPQLPSKRQIMAKILREREEAAALKRDPVYVDPDAEAR